MNLFTRLEREIGDIEEFDRQQRISRELGLKIVGPVYRAWRPDTKIRANHSANLKKVLIIVLLRQTISFVNLHELVTVRQIYYGLVSKQVIWNNKHEYQRVVRIVKRGRLAGLISFDAVIDDTRQAEKTPSWNSIEEIIEAAINQYRSDWWFDQPYYVEVWLEKRALRRIFYRNTNLYDVHLCIGGGYQSWSEVWVARKRFELRNQKIIILYFGDLDPSGKDMPRDITERFNEIKIPVTVKEIALTKQDIKQYNLPRNPTKSRDTRKQWYIEKYGIDYGVELDALPPEVLKDKIHEAIRYYSDLDMLIEKSNQDEGERERMKRIIGEGKN